METPTNDIGVQQMDRAAPTWLGAIDLSIGPLAERPDAVGSGGSAAEVLLPGWAGASSWGYGPAGEHLHHSHAPPTLRASPAPPRTPRGGCSGRAER